MLIANSDFIKDIEFVQIEPKNGNGYYQINFEITDEQDNYVEESVQFQLNIVKLYRNADFSDLESIAQTDFPLTNDLHASCTDLIKIFDYEVFLDPIEKNKDRTKDSSDPMDDEEFF